MSDVSSNTPAHVRLWVACDVHKFSIVAATLPPSGGAPEVHRIETTEAAIRRFIARLGGPDGLAVCYEAGPGGFELLRLLTRAGVACDVVAPSLVPVRAGDRVKTDRRDATKLVRLYRAGELVFVAAPDERTEGLRDLMRCRDDLRCARTAPPPADAARRRDLNARPHVIEDACAFAWLELVAREPQRTTSSAGYASSRDARRSGSSATTAAPSSGR